MNNLSEPEQLPPDRWLERLRGEEPDRGRAIEELGSLLKRGLNRSLNQRYGVPFQVEDIVQESLLKILSSLDQFEGRSRFLTWAMTIATRVGISALRREHARTLSLDALSGDSSWRLEWVDHRQRSSAHALERKLILRQLEELIETELTSRQRMAIRALLEGMAVDELARRLECQRNAIYKLIHDARLKLRRGLERQGVAIEEIQAFFAEGE